MNKKTIMAMVQDVDRLIDQIVHEKLQKQINYQRVRNLQQELDKILEKIEDLKIAINVR